MITGLGGATIWSSNINNLLPFYRDVVGLKPGGGTPAGDFVLFGDQTQPALALGTIARSRAERATHTATSSG